MREAEKKKNIALLSHEHRTGRELPRKWDSMITTRDTTVKKRSVPYHPFCRAQK